MLPYMVVSYAIETKFALRLTHTPALHHNFVLDGRSAAVSDAQVVARLAAAAALCALLKAFCSATCR